MHYSQTEERNPDTRGGTRGPADPEGPREPSGKMFRIYGDSVHLQSSASPVNNTLVSIDFAACALQAKMLFGPRETLQTLASFVRSEIKSAMNRSSQVDRQQPGGPRIEVRAQTSKRSRTHTGHWGLRDGVS